MLKVLYLHFSMKNFNEFVFIFKGVSEDCHSGIDPFSAELESKGFLTKTISVLDFNYKNIDVLKTKLSHPQLYSGIVFTSPRCVRAVINAIEDTKCLNQKWQELYTFAVGETTARLISDDLGLNPKGGCTGNGVTLAPIILSYKPNKPLLLPCGNLKTDTLESLLTQGGVSTECVEVYDTVAHPSLESTLYAALSQQKPSYIVYFSPSGIQNTYHLLKQNGVDLEKIKWVSIGPTTAAALQSYGLRVHCSAAKPTPQCLAEAILSTKS